MTKKEWKFVNVTTYQRLTSTTNSRGNQEVKLKTLDSVTFSQPFGEIVGLVGGKGAGQETLRDLLINITKPDEGLIRGFRETAFSASITGLELEEKTGDSFVRSVFFGKGMNRKRLPDFLEATQRFSELGELFTKRVSSYSASEKSQFMLSIAINLEPSIIFIDDCLNSVNEPYFLKVIGELENLKIIGASIWLNIETIEKITPYCDKLLWLEFGKLKQFGHPQEVLLKHHEYMKKLQELPIANQQYFWEQGYKSQMDSLGIEEAQLPEMAQDFTQEILRAKNHNGRKTRRMRHRKKKSVKGAVLALVVLILSASSGVLYWAKGRAIQGDGHTSLSLASHSQQAGYSTTRVQSSTTKGETKLEVAPFEHIVKIGESLEGIAKTYGVTLEELMTVNKLTDSDIHAGQSLALPKGVKETIGAESEKKPVTEVELPQTQGPIQHTVVKGENLFRISQKYGVDVMAIQKANRLQSQQIDPGQVLVIPQV